MVQTTLFTEEELEATASQQAKSSTSILKEELEKIKLLKAVIERLEKELKEHNAMLNAAEQRVLPSIMVELGIDSFEADDGTKVKITDVYNPKILNEQAFFEYLERHNEDSIVKHRFSVDLPRDYEEEAASVREALIDMDVPFTEATNIHPATLKKYVSDAVQAGRQQEIESFVQINKLTIAKVK